MNRIKLAMTTAMTACLMAAVSARANLVVNGGFETGDTSGWTITGNPSDPSYFFVLGGGGQYDGNYASWAGPYGHVAYLSQTLSTTPGDSYLVDFWLDDSTGATPNEFSANWGGVTLVDQNPVPQQGWTEYSFTVTGTGSDILKFGFRDDPDFLRLDEVSVVDVTEVAAVPEPVTLISGTLLLLPFGASSWRRLRRSRFA